MNNAKQSYSLLRPRDVLLLDLILSQVLLHRREIEYDFQIHRKVIGQESFTLSSIFLFKLT